MQDYSNSNSHGYINVYFGRRGSGKTQQGAIDAYEAYKRGEIVISNIWLNFPHIRFKKTADLIPILSEISEYCNDVKMPIEAPNAMLSDYSMKRKKGKVKKFFLLFDEIGKHLDNRNWHKNFKDDFLIDMLTEPRKYGLTIVGICQEWNSIDIKFRTSAEDWFIFSKAGWWIFERLKCTHIWVINGTFDFDKPIILGQKSKFTFWNKSIQFLRGLYWTGEIVGSGSREKIPHLFIPGSIYTPKFRTRRILPLIQPVSDMSEANKGEKAKLSGESPAH